MAKPQPMTKAEAGRLGARSRWGGDPRVVRIGDLTSDQRRLVLALVAAARESGADKSTPPAAA